MIPTLLGAHGHTRTCHSTWREGCEESAVTALLAWEQGCWTWDRHLSPCGPVLGGKQPRAQGRARRVAGGTWNRGGLRRGGSQRGGVQEGCRSSPRRNRMVRAFGTAIPSPRDACPLTPFGFWPNGHLCFPAPTRAGTRGARCITCVADELPAGRDLGDFIPCCTPGSSKNEAPAIHLLKQCSENGTDALTDGQRVGGHRHCAPHGLEPCHAVPWGRASAPPCLCVCSIDVCPIPGPGAAQGMDGSREGCFCAQRPLWGARL